MCWWLCGPVRGGTDVLLANEVPGWLYSCMQVRTVRVGMVENWRELGLRKSQFGEFLQIGLSVGYL